MAADDDYQAPGTKKTCSQRCDEFSKAIWNSEKGEFIGRTAGSWAKIGLFYLIFYSCLAGFFALMLAGFFSTLDDDQPKQQGMWSLIKGNPGMGFRPMPSIETTLIHFNSDNKESYKKHVEDIEKMLKQYENQTDAIECDENHRPSEDPSQRKVCKVDLDALKGTECTKNNSYGYAEGMPCVLLKVNKVYGWKPIPFNESDSDDSREREQEAEKLLGYPPKQDFIGVSCEGENEGDEDNIYKRIVSPEFGFSYAYFPYYNTKGYLPPLVFVKFDVRPGVLIQVWCKLWAGNIKHHKNDKAGSTHFELLVDH